MPYLELCDRVVFCFYNNIYHVIWLIIILVYAMEKLMVDFLQIQKGFGH